MEVVLEDFKETVLTNAVVTTSGSSVVFNGFGAKQIVLLINVSGTVTGTTPTIQFTIKEIDPGDAVTPTGVSATGAVLNATGVQIVELPVTRSSFIQVTWTVTGSSPVFNGVYATLINKVAGTTVLYDNVGNAVFGTAGTPGAAVLSVQGVSGGTAAPVNQGAPNTLANKWPVQVTDGTNVMPTADVAARAQFDKITDGTNTAAVKAASTAAAAADPSLVVGLSPNSPLPTGTNSIGSVVQGTGAAAGAPWSVELSDGAAFYTGTKTGQLPSALVGGRLDENVGSWLGSTAPTVGSKTSANSVPVVIASDQAAVAVTAAQATAANLNATVTQGPGSGAAATFWYVRVTDGTNTLPTMDTAARAGFQKVTDGTNTAAVKAASTAAAATDPALVVAISPNNAISIAAADVSATGALGALNATVAVTHPGLQSIGMQLAAGTFVGTIIPEFSFDGGTTWNATYFADPITGNITSSLVFGASNTATDKGIVAVSGAGMTRLRVSAFTSGTANATVRASAINDPSVLYGGASGSVAPPVVAQVGGSDGSNLRPILTDSSGRQVVNQGTAAALAANWPVQVTDGTHTMPTADVAARKAFVALTDGTNTTAVKAASTAAAAADPSAVVALSPNSPLPTGTNSIGAVTQATAANFNATVVQGAGSGAAATFWYVRVTDGTNTLPTMDVAARKGFQAITDGTNTTAVKAASTAAAAADPSLVVAFSPNSPLPTGANVIGAVTQSGTWTVAQGAPNTLANKWPVQITDGTNTLPTGDAVGRAIFEKITDGTNTSAVKAASTAAVAGDPALVVSISPNTPIIVGVSQNDTTATGSLGALNATVSVALAGTAGAAMQLVAGTLVGTIVPETSVDGGTTWVSTYFDDPATGNIVSSIVFGSSNTATTRTLVGTGGASNVRVRVSAFTSGTATANLRASSQTEPSVLFTGPAASTTQPPALAQIGGWDGTTLRAANVKAASTAPVASDQALVVVISPNQTALPVSSTPLTSTPGIAAGYIATTATANVALRATTYTEQSANFTGSIVSSSANDTSAGTGARTVKITFVDSTGATAGTETATLNGTTAVNLVTTTKCFIEKIEVVTVGGSGSNAGIITLWSGSGGTGTTIGTIAVADNRTFWAHHYVVTGKTCNITGMTGLNNNASNESVFTLQATVVPVANQVTEQVSDWITGGQNNQTLRTYGSLIKVPGPARVVMFVAPGGTPNILNRGSFDFYDQ